MHVNDVKETKEDTTELKGTVPTSVISALFEKMKKEQEDKQLQFDFVDGGTF
jgi:hypothetical protein